MRLKALFTKPHGGQAKYVALAAALLAIGITPLATAKNGDVVRAGGRTASTKETRIIGDSSTYATRQSNPKLGDGGSAAYGCRANPEDESCLFVFNVRDGRAFEFRSRGPEAGRLIVEPPSGNPRDVRPPARTPPAWPRASTPTSWTARTPTS